MNRGEKMEFFAPVRYAASALIAMGGALHGVAAYGWLKQGQTMPWWAWAVFLGAMLAYPAAGALILANRRTGYLITCIGPTLGGLAIFGGFFSGDGSLLVLLPGTLVDEITWTGFLTLIAESVAVAACLLCLAHRVPRQDTW